MPTLPVDFSMPTPDVRRPRPVELVAATFPDFPVLYSSPSTYESDLRIDRSVDGTGRARSFWPQAKRTIDVKLPVLTQDERDVLVAFYNANLAEPFSFPVDCPPVPMSVVFAGAPNITPLGNDQFEASFRITQFP